MSVPSCRSCSAPLSTVFVDLGMSPLSNNFLTPEALPHKEPFYPLRVFVCDECLLVQLEEFASPKQIFSDYAYFSSYSTTWLSHAESYVDLVVQRFRLGKNSRVIEIASNDGYLLQYFLRRKIPVLGVEPAANVAQVAIQRGIPTLVRFFGEGLAKELQAVGTQADLIVANNVLAHVPALNDFVEGIRVALKPAGVATFEFPHLLNLVRENQFDTIYHEHFSYFSLAVVRRIFAKHGLRVFDVDELPTHGGSLRVYACQDRDSTHPSMPRVDALLEREEAAGLGKLETYSGFAARVVATKRHLLAFLTDAKARGKTVVGYGAPAKGNTLLNYCGIHSDLLGYIVDVSPHKQGRFVPGVRIPIFAPDKIFVTRPDYVLILPWNLKREIAHQMAAVRSWGGKFVVPIPDVQVLA